MKTLTKSLGWIGLIVVIVFAGAIGKFVGESTTERFLDGKREGSLDSALMQAASQINENLPMMIDSDTRLDTTIGMNGKFRYNYTLVNYAAEDLDPIALQDAMRPGLINGYCTTADMKTFVDNNVPVTYAYSGKAGKEIAAVTISAEQCEGS